MPVELHPHQEEAIAKMHNGCILYGGVGVGKTITSLGYYFTKVAGGQINNWGTMTTPKDLYVITTAKVRDSKAFELQAAQYGVHEDSTISTNGVKITVDSWNNLKKYVGVENAFFIFDEQRVVGYGAWARAFIKIARANEWILLSATPGDTWLDYIPVFIANGWYKHKTDFLDQHVIWTPRVKYPKVLRYQNVGVLVKHRNSILVHMPYERHTKRHPVDVRVEYDQDLFDKVVKKRWHVYENRPLRDVGELFVAMRRVVNSDASRIGAVQTLMSKHPKLIVFYNFDYELEMLRELGNTLTMNQRESSSTDSSSQNQLCMPSEVESGSEKCPIQHAKIQTSSQRTEASSSSHSTCSEMPMELGQETAEERSGCETPLSTTKKVNPTFLSLGSDTGAKHQESLSKQSSTPSHDSSQPTQCPGHWTVDRGEGERWLTCKEFRKLSRMIDSGSTSHELSEETGSIGRRSTQTERGGNFSVAEWNGHRHQEIPKTDSWLYLVQYRAGAEGWNCVETDAVVFFSQTYSYRDWWQAHGRIDRLNTPFTDLWYYNLISSSIIDKAIRKALKAKKNFNERDLHLG